VGFGSGGHELSPNSHLVRTLARAHRYGLGRHSPAKGRFRVYEMVGPVPARLLDQLPTWSRHRHSDELSRVADRLTVAGVDTSSLGPTWRPSVGALPGQPPTPADEHRDTARPGATDRLAVVARRHDGGHLHVSCG
jgi:hypothetical protein